MNALAVIPNHAETQKVIQLVDQVLRQGSEQSVASDYPLVYRPANRRNVRAVRMRGKVVSTVAYHPLKVSCGGSRFTAAMVSLMATHPAYRGRGYALDCINGIIRQLTADRIPLAVLWTMVPTFGFYEHADFQAVQPQTHSYPLSRRDARLFKHYGYTVIPYDASQRKYLAALRTLHLKAVSGSIRRTAAYPALFSLPRMKTFLALRNGELAAYLVVSEAEHKPGLIESGGAGRGLQALVKHVLSSLPPRALLMAYGHSGSCSIDRLLRKHMPDRRQVCDEHPMVRLTSPRRFLGMIRPWLEASCPRPRFNCSLGIYGFGTVSLEFGPRGLHIGQRKLEEHVTLTRRELTSIIFGQHPERRIAVPNTLRWIRPLPLPIWLLDRS